MKIVYDYKRNNYSGRGQNYNNDNISRHHIISYPHMYEFGVILLAYFQILGDALDSDPLFQRFLGYYGWSAATNQATIHTLLNEHKMEQHGVFDYCKENCRNFFMTIAWTDANLFAGPAGKLRSDDPDQQKDAIPLSLTQNSFINKLVQLRKSDMIKGRPAMRQGDSGELSLEKENIVRIAHEYICSIPNVIQPLETKVSDWRAVRLEEKSWNKGYDCYEIFFSNSAKNDGMEQNAYKLELAYNPNCISAAQINQKLCKDKVVVLTKVESKRSDDYFLGVLKNKEPSHLEQANENITGRIR